MNKADEHRYLIRLPTWLYEKLREEAFRTRQPIAELVRRCLIQHYGPEPSSSPAASDP